MQEIPNQSKEIYSYFITASTAKRVMHCYLYISFMNFWPIRHWTCSQRNESRSGKPFRNVIRTLSWFESLILPFVNAKLFQIRLLKRGKKGAFWIVIRVESLILRTCERKALSERDSCVRILEMRAEAMLSVNQRGLRSRNKILPRSAQILFVSGTAFAMLVNAHSSNHEPNQEADRDPKRLSEHDSFLCEQAHCHSGGHQASSTTNSNFINKRKFDGKSKGS